MDTLHETFSFLIVGEWLNMRRAEVRGRYAEQMWVETKSGAVGYVESDLPSHTQQVRDESSSFWDRAWINIDTGAVVALINTPPFPGVEAHSFALYSWTAQSGLVGLGLKWPNYKNQWYSDDGDHFELRVNHLAALVSKMLDARHEVEG